jgi:hypothetical protein
MNKDTQYSTPWRGQDGKMWREVSYWNGFGYQTFLQYLTLDGWMGY